MKIGDRSKIEEENERTEEEEALMRSLVHFYIVIWRGTRNEAESALAKRVRFFRGLFKEPETPLVRFLFTHLSEIFFERARWEAGEFALPFLDQVISPSTGVIKRVTTRLALSAGAAALDAVVIFFNEPSSKLPHLIYGWIRSYMSPSSEGILHLGDNPPKSSVPISLALDLVVRLRLNEADASSAPLIDAAARTDSELARALRRMTSDSTSIVAFTNLTLIANFIEKALLFGAPPPSAAWADRNQVAEHFVRTVLRF